MNFVDYNLNNIRGQLEAIGLIPKWVSPVYANDENSSQTAEILSDDSGSTLQRVPDIFQQDREIKRETARSLPPSPTRKNQSRSRAKSLSNIAISSIAHSSIRKVRFAILNDRVSGEITSQKCLLKKDVNRAVPSEEMPSWWMPQLASLLKTPEKEIGKCRDDDRLLVYEYLRKAHLPKLRNEYEKHFEEFLPKTLKHLLTIVRDQEFIHEVKQVNQWVYDADIKAAEQSIIAARAAINKKLFE